MRRWPMMLGGLLAAGAAIGAVGALVARRRANSGQWEEYGTPRSTTDFDSTAESAKSAVRSATESGKEKVQSLAESAKERAADLMGSSGATGSSGSSAGSSGSSGPAPNASNAADFGTREDLYGKTGTSRNSR